MGRLKTIRTGKGIDRRHQEGQVTIFLTLLLVVLLPVLFLTLEVIRYEQAKGRISHIMVGAVEQVMADYQVEMEQWYHIYTLDENYLGKGKEVASNRVWDYLEENLLSVDWLGRVKGFYNFQVKDAQMIPKQYLYENQCEHLKSQIHGWAIHTMLPNQKRRTRTNENARNQKSRSVSNPVERKEQENRSNEKESQAIIDMLDPRNLIEEIKRLGILTVASNDRLPLSKVKILGEEFAVKARVEYIEGYSGHADQEWLLNFVYSFTTKMPDHIFLVHGEPHSQETLKQKIEETTNIGVTIPKYGEEYTLDNNLEKCQHCINPANKQKQRIDILDKMDALESEIEEMKHILKENIRMSSNYDEDIVKLNNRVNDLRRQILEIMQNK